MALPEGSHLLVTGGTGFIGRNLCPVLMARGFRVSVLTRNIANARKILPAGVHLLDNLGQLETGPAVDAVVNLAGEPLSGRRWTSARKQAFQRSRVDFTRSLFDFFASESRPAPKILVSGSAIGYYGPHGDELLSETGNPTASFSSQLCADWENAAFAFRELGTRVVCVRTGIVLGKGGALAAMLPAFRFGMGGPMASGNQWMSWIHMEDMVNILVFCLDQPGLGGPVNATAPNPVTNREFSRQLGRALGRPSRLPLPGVVLKLLFGEMAEELLVTGQRVIPSRLQESGFEFAWPGLEAALSRILRC